MMTDQRRAAIRAAAEATVRAWPEGPVNFVFDASKVTIECLDEADRLTARVAELEREIGILSAQYDCCDSTAEVAVRALESVGAKFADLQADNARLRTVLVDADRAISGGPMTLGELQVIVRDALSPAPAEAQGDPIPVSRMYYIQNKGYVGNCLLWWREGGNGYTCDLSEAWLVTEEKAKDICRSRPEEDIPHPVELVNSVAVRHVSCEQFRLALAAAQEALKGAK